MLRGVVDEGGTGRGRAVPGYTVAGKTGTAEKPGRGRLLDVEVRRLVRRLRAGEEPRLVVLVMVDEPKGAIWGGVVAAPAFAEIARFGLQYLEFRPTRPTLRRVRTDAEVPHAATGAGRVLVRGRSGWWAGVPERCARTRWSSSA